MTDRTCSINGCQRRRWARGWCTSHYSNWRLYGDPSIVGPNRRSPSEKFAARWRLDEASGCHLWIGNLSRGGYALFTFSGAGRSYMGHKWAYEQKYGPVPPGLELDHFYCSRTQCVNPDHVRPVTPRENIYRSGSPPAWNLAKTHCIHGHEFTLENTYVNRRGWRSCRRCSRERDRRKRS
jgi:hypothetical protein